MRNGRNDRVVGAVLGTGAVVGVVILLARYMRQASASTLSLPRERTPEERPASQPAPQGPPAPSVAPPTVEAWRSYVQKLAPAFGLVGPGWEAFIMKYITMESGGRPCSVGFPGELDETKTWPAESGIGQFMSPHDLRLAGTTAAEMRAACSAEVVFPGLTRASPAAQIAAARAKAEAQVRPLTEDEKTRQVVALLTFFSNIARIVDKSFSENGVTWPKTSADYFAMIKGYHAGQSFPTAGVAAAKRALGHPPRMWGEFTSGYLSTIIDPNVRARHAHALDNARRAGAGSGLPWIEQPSSMVSGSSTGLVGPRARAARLASWGTYVCR